MRELKGVFERTELMSSIVDRITDTCIPDLSRDLDLLQQGTSGLLHTIENQGQEALNLSVSLAQGYASRTGTDLLSPDLLTVLTRTNNLEPAAVCRAAIDPDTLYDGVFVGSDGRTFPSITPLNRIPAVRPSDGRQPNETIIYI